MTASLWMNNIGAFGLQVTLVVAAGAALAWALRLREPRAALAYWRALLLACLVLPVCQPWKVTEISTVTASVLPDVSANVTPDGGGRHAAGPARLVRTETAVLLVLAAGGVARGAWLAIGACGLWRLRRNARPLVPLPPAIRNALTRVGARAGFYVSDGIPGPITFGLFRPVVLLPPSVTTMPPHVQEAITYHELLHVRRRDWLYELSEEAVRTMLWFHPAIWWLIERIQLSREQVVDRAAIGLTQSSERYIDALLVVALARSSVTLRPAPPFLRRSLLKKRVAQILQEPTMTTLRLITSLTVSAAAVGLAASVAVRSFPLEAQARVAATPAPVEIVKGGDHLLHSSMPEYPRRALEAGIQGDIVLDLSVDARGEVSDARVLSGPEELRRPALESALRWHFSPSVVSSTAAQAVVRFNLQAARIEPDERRHQTAVARLRDKIVELDPADRQLFAKVEDERFAKRAFAELDQAKVEDERFAKRAFAEFDQARVEDERFAKRAFAELDQAKVEDERFAKRAFAGFDQAKSEDERFAKRAFAEFEQAKSEDQMKREMFEKALSSSDTTHEQQDEMADGRGWREIGKAGIFEGSPRLAAVETERVSEATAAEVIAQAGTKVGDLLTEDSAKRIVEAAKTLDEHLHVQFQRDGKGGIVVTILAR